jgi:LysR family transcriptional activator of mexEF-oprN operon
VFRVGLSDALEVALMPELMRRLAKMAPHARLVTRTTDGLRVSGMLDSGEIELAVGVFRERLARQRTRPLFNWKFVCVFNPRLIKPHRPKLSMKEYLRHPHVLTSFTADLRGYIDEQLAGMGLRREVVFSSPNFATSPFIVQQVPAMTTVPTFIAGAWRDALGLAVRPLPFRVPEFEVSLAWMDVNDADAGLSWLISLFADAFTGKAFV